MRYLECKLDVGCWILDRRTPDDERCCFFTVLHVCMIPDDRTETHTEHNQDYKPKSKKLDYKTRQDKIREIEDTPQNTLGIDEAKGLDDRKLTQNDTSELYTLATRALSSSVSDLIP